MAEHRIRLDDEDIALIVAALRSRAGMTRGKRRHRCLRLISRLNELRPGNPQWLLDELEQTHEVPSSEIYHALYGDGPHDRARS
jgi:hypothetical protein